MASAQGGREAAGRHGAFVTGPRRRGAYRGRVAISPEYLNQFTEPVGYLDHARVGPLSKAVRTTAASLLEELAKPGPGTVTTLLNREASRAKQAVARACRTDADHVVLEPNTSTALFQTAFNLARGEVLVSTGEFPANLYPWVRAEQLGLARVRWMPPGPVTPERVRAAITPETSVVSVSAVSFRTGYRADLAALRDVVGDRLLVVDAIQGFGVVDEPWEVADVLVSGGQKWLRAGHGTGFAVLSDRALERMQPVLSGWTGARDVDVFDDRVHEPLPTAQAWSLTYLSPVSAGMLATALELVELAGVGAIAARIEERLREFDSVLEGAGARIVSERERRAGILVFEVPGRPAPKVADALAAEGITVSVRGPHVRLSAHASTSPEAVKMVEAALSRAR